jgi:hypothetical protein
MVSVDELLTAMEMKVVGHLKVVGKLIGEDSLIAYNLRLKRHLCWMVVRSSR